MAKLDLDAGRFRMHSEPAQEGLVARASRALDILFGR
jgi:hypothetical protein